MTEVHRAIERNKIRDARIAELTEKIEKQDMEIDALNREIASLLREIEAAKE